MACVACMGAWAGGPPRTCSAISRRMRVAVGAWYRSGLRTPPKRPYLQGQGAGGQRAGAGRAEEGRAGRSCCNGAAPGCHLAPHGLCRTGSLAQSLCTHPLLSPRPLPPAPAFAPGHQRPRCGRPSRPPPPPRQRLRPAPLHPHHLPLHACLCASAPSQRRALLASAPQACSCRGRSRRGVRCSTARRPAGPAGHRPHRPRPRRQAPCGGPPA